MTPERPHKLPPSFADSKTGRTLKERARNGLITGTAGGYLGGMLIEGKARVKIPQITRKLLGIRRKTVGIHGARAGALIGALAGAANKGKRSDTVDAVATGGDWKFAAGKKVKVRVVRVQGQKVQPFNRDLPDERPDTKVMFSAYAGDVNFDKLPKDVQADVTRFVDAKKDTPVVHYGMTVKELLTKADPVNLQTARKNLGTFRASRAADEVLTKTKEGSKYVLLMNDRVIDGHHFLAKAERGKVTSSLNVLDLTPARLMTKLGADEKGLHAFEAPNRKQSAAIGAAVPVAAGGLLLGTRGGRNALRVVLKRMDKNDPRRMRMASVMQKRKDASIVRNSNKAVAKARDQFRAEALPKAPKDPTISDAVKTVRKRVKQKVVKAVSNIGANPGEVQMSTQFAAERDEKTGWRKRAYGDLAGEHAGAVAGFVGANKAYNDLWKKGKIPAKAVVPLGVASIVGGQVLGGYLGKKVARKIHDKAVPADQHPKLSKTQEALGDVYARQNTNSYAGHAVGGAGLALAGHGILRGRAGVNRTTAAIGGGAAVLARALRQKKINRVEDEDMRAHDPEKDPVRAIGNLGRTLKHNTLPVLGLVGGAAMLAKSRGKILAATGRVSRKMRAGSRHQVVVKRTNRVPPGKGPILDASTGAAYPALTEKRAAAPKRKVVKKAKKSGEVQMSAIEFASERTRTQNLRDKIGLAKDVAGLGATVGAGVGAHKLYKQGKVVLRKVGPQVSGAVKVWHDAALKAGSTLDVVKDAVSPVAATNRGVADGWRKVVKAAKKATMWMHDDPRAPLRFEAPVPRKRDKLDTARDAALIGGGVATAAGAGVLAYQGGKAVKGLAKRGRAMLRNVPVKKIGDNVRNSTRISADVGRLYGNLTDDVRNPKRYVTKVRGAFRGGVAAGQAAPVKPWARRAVKVGKALRLLESGKVPFQFGAEIAADAPYGVVDSRSGGLMHRTSYAKRSLSRRVRDNLNLKFGGSRYDARLLSGAHLTAAVMRAKKGVHFSQFGAGASLLLSGVGTLVGSQAGGRMRYAVQNRVKKSLAPRVGAKWARRVGRVAGYAPENVGAIAGGVAGSVLGGGIRRRSEMSRAGNALFAFGGREQLKDIHSSRFLDPLDVAVGRKRGHTADQVKKYQRDKNYVQDVKDRRRVGSATAVAAAQARMDHIMNSPAQPAHAQVVRSLYHKAGTVRKVTERGGSLVNDSLAHLRGDPRGKDASGRLKKREWEKPWFQHAKTQVAAAAALGGGYLVLAKHPKFRAKFDRGVRGAQRKVNSVLTGTFPGVAPLRKKGDKTNATIAAKQQAAAVAKATKTQQSMSQNATNIATAAQQVRSGRKITRAAAVPAKTPAVQTPVPGSKPPKKKFALISGRLIQFDDPLDAGWDLRDARGRSARVFAPGSRGRDRRPKAWHEKVENERKLWGAAAAVGTLTGGLAGRKLLQGQLKQKVKLATAPLEKKVARYRAVAKSQQQRLKAQAQKKNTIVAFPRPESPMAA